MKLFIVWIESSASSLLDSNKNEYFLIMAIDINILVAHNDDFEPKPHSR